MSLRLIISSGILLLPLFIIGCASDNVSGSRKTKQDIQFADISSFDRDLVNAFAEPLPEVNVSVLAKISPHSVPDRMARWMTAIDQNGGTVKFIPPENEANPKGIVSILAIATSIWSSRDMVTQVRREIGYKNAKSYDADVYLRRDERGDSVIDKIVFRKVRD